MNVVAWINRQLRGHLETRVAILKDLAALEPNECLGPEEFIPACPEHDRERIVRLGDGRLVCDCTREEPNDDME